MADHCLVSELEYMGQLIYTDTGKLMSASAYVLEQNKLHQLMTFILLAVHSKHI